MIPALAVYGCNLKPENVPLGKVNLRTFDNLESLVSEIRVHKPMKILSYSLSIKANLRLQVLSDALSHIMSADGGDNLIGHYPDGRKDDPGRYIFLVSSQITANPDFLFQLDSRPRGGKAKKIPVSVSPSRGSQI